VSYFRGYGCITRDTQGQVVKLYWMRTTDAWPEYTWLESQFTCFDEEKNLIGRATAPLTRTLATCSRSRAALEVECGFIF